MAYETVVHCTDDTQDATTPAIPHDVDLTLRAAAPSTTPAGATKSGQGSAQGQATSSQTNSKPESKAPKKLGNGVIAAIVIGILALFGFLAILFLLLRKRKPESSSDHDRGNSKANDTLAPSPFIAENGNADKDFFVPQEAHALSVLVCPIRCQHRLSIRVCLSSVPADCIL
ncbi:hypothetical protein F5878DRAFT_616248 [Lentinula raphanica]|uniref:Mid2 domain-containing protein n=1 Tax=Lentinula raphanica TaxID=153919 RepID=A0AA38PBF5_9AGAR|nr:hypothetical protein F5878DRAFT_616248 [Lentinula raphanica]